MPPLSAPVWLPITLKPPTEVREQMIGGFARSVRIENPTAAYWYLPEALTFIQPFISGRVVRYPSGIEKFSILFLAPQDLEEPANVSFVNSPAATFILTSEDAPTDSGTLLGGTSANREFVTIPANPVSGVALYTLARPAPEGITMWFEYNGSLAAGFVSLSAQVLAFNPLTNWSQRLISSSVQLDSINPSPIFRYPHPIPALTRLTLVTGFDPNVSIRLAF